MKKIILIAAVFLFFSPCVIQADTDSARNDLASAGSYVSDARTFARRASETPVLEEAQFNARKAENAAAEAEKAIQKAVSDLD